MIPLNDWIESQKTALCEFIDQISTNPTVPLDEIPVPHSDINFGKEMASIYQYISENQDLIIKNMPTTDAKDHGLISKLVAVIDKLKSQETLRTNKRTKSKNIKPMSYTQVQLTTYKEEKIERISNSSEWTLSSKYSKETLLTESREDKLIRAVKTLQASIDQMKKQYIELVKKYDQLNEINIEFRQTITQLTEQRDNLAEELKRLHHTNSARTPSLSQSTIIYGHANTEEVVSKMSTTNTIPL